MIVMHIIGLDQATEEDRKIARAVIRAVAVLSPCEAPKSVKVRVLKSSIVIGHDSTAFAARTAAKVARRIEKACRGLKPIKIVRDETE